MSKFGFRDFDYDFKWVNNKVDYFKEKIKELYDELYNGTFRINDNIDLTSNQLENIAIDEFGDMFWYKHGFPTLDEQVVDGMINEETAEMIFDSFFSKIMKSIIDKIRANIMDFEDEHKEDLSEDELEQYEDDIYEFDKFTDDFEDKSIDCIIQSWMSEDRVKSIKSAERLTRERATHERRRCEEGLEVQYPIYPNITEMSNPNISDYKARTIYEAATDNIDLPSVIQGMNGNIQTMSDAEVYDVYHSCALDKEINKKDKVKYYGQDLANIMNAKSNNTIDSLISNAQKAAAAAAAVAKPKNILKNIKIER